MQKEKDIEVVKVTFIRQDGTSQEVDAPAGTSAMEAGRNAGVDGIVAECGGACSCATCHVHVAQEWIEKVGRPGDEEAEMLDFAEGVDADRSRLSCQIELTEELDGVVLNVQDN